MKSGTSVLPASLIVLAVLVSGPGCGGDPATPPATGVVDVTVSPETLAAPWLLTGPAGYTYQGTGSERLGDLASGDYGIAWGSVDGWLRPQPETVTATLVGGGEVNFAGEYREGASLVIETLPAGLAAPWSVQGPDGYLASGVGAAVLEALAAGEYRLTWGVLSGYDSPDPADATYQLAAGAIVVARGEYGIRPGDLTLVPDLETAAWRLDAVDGGSAWSGAGPIVFEDIAPGDYRLTWEPMEGWLTPPPTILTLPSGGELVHEVRFLATPVRAVAPAGGFVMGGPTEEPGYEPDEFPQHQVFLSRAFEVSVTEVTNAQYVALAQWAYDHGLAVCDGVTLTPADDVGLTLMNLGLERCEIAFADGVFFLRDVGWGLQPEHPVVGASWYGAVSFCNWMSLYEGLAPAYGADWICNGNDPYGAEGYRLLTEAEWEYACRAGTTTGFWAGEITDVNCDDPVLEQIGWYCGNSEERVHPVAQLPANPWGLYDMHGNLFEWVNDVSTPRYSSATVTDPVVTTEGSSRTVRGGTSAFSGLWKALNCRAANRSVAAASMGAQYIGIRVARTVPSGSR